jgi:hypothetical protein
MHTHQVVVARTFLGLGAAVFIAASAIPGAGAGAGALGQGSPRTAASASSPAELFVPTDRAAMIAKQQAFLQAHPHTGIANHRGDERVYGMPFATGTSPVATAESFKNTHITMFGADPADMVPQVEFLANLGQGNTLPLMYNRAAGGGGTYKFTAVYYSQQRDGVPVYGSQLVVLTRNDAAAGYPAVLANPDVRPLGNFHVTPQQAAAPMPGAALRNLQARFGAAPGDVNIFSTQRVIWAGLQEEEVDPRLADNTVLIVNGYDEWRVITDATTGDILHEEHMICFGAPVDGTARGVATEGIGAEQCEDEIPQVLPYLRITSGANSAVTDADGYYTIDPDGATIGAILDGTWFDVTHFTGTNTSESIPVGSPADFLFNSANTDPLVRAQVNTYIESNRVRDYVLQYSPSYPDIGTHLNFPARANRVDNFCPGNAWYSPTEQSINFCQAGPSNPNTSWSSVIHHEYGHHLVNMAGSGQGAYGEGSGDVMSVLVLDDFRLGLGFFNSCATWLRDASLPCQYQTSGCSSCGSAIHSCGQLLSSSVWSIRNNLLATNPLTYRDIISELAINAMPLHTGTSINPTITVDYLTLDDDDANILNGTPHYNEINGGFSDHNMPGPALILVDFLFPDGRPDYVSPNGTTTIRVDVTNIAGTPLAGTGLLFADTGSGFQQYAMTEISANSYEAVIPASACGTNVKYYFRATASGDVFQFAPGNAPASYYAATSAFDADVAINDNFQTDQGWTVTDAPTGTFTGTWQRGVPFTPSNANTPAADADGSGQCYVTGNAANVDVDNGTTTLTSPLLDASVPGLTLSYYRWYRTSTTTSDTLLVEFTTNDGASWTTLETFGPVTTGSWVLRTYDLDTVPGFTPTNQFRIRFVARDLATQQVIEAAVDAVKLEHLICVQPCPADVTGGSGGDGIVNIDDLLFIINNWGAPGGPADVNGSGLVDIDDLLQVINSWGDC